MFHRMFGRRRSPVEGEPNADSGTEATEGQADIVNSDDFVLLGEMLFFSLFFFFPLLFFWYVFFIFPLFHFFLPNIFFFTSSCYSLLWPLRIYAPAKASKSNSQEK